MSITTVADLYTALRDVLLESPTKQVGLSFTYKNGHNVSYVLNITRDSRGNLILNHEDHSHTRDLR